MKIINDYCDCCNSQKICVEIDNYDAIPVLNICLDCMSYAYGLFEKDRRENVCFWDAYVSPLSFEDQERMRINFIAAKISEIK